MMFYTLHSFLSFTETTTSVNYIWRFHTPKVLLDPARNWLERKDPYYSYATDLSS